MLTGVFDNDAIVDDDLIGVRVDPCTPSCPLTNR
jgi:hypothetical protein